MLEDGLEVALEIFTTPRRMRWICGSNGKKSPSV
jgi:hypothetical protein